MAHPWLYAPDPEVHVATLWFLSPALFTVGFMFAATRSVALVGGDAKPVLVEAHVGRQQEAFKLSGLPDTAVREAKDRVRAAFSSSGVRFPNRTVTVNLAPADLPKGGTDYDLPIALGILAAANEIPRVDEAIVVGELSLDGAIRPAANTLGAGVLSARTGTPCLVARPSAGEVAAIPGARAYGVGSLAEAIDVLRHGLEAIEPALPTPSRDGPPTLDLRDVRGQSLARRALEVAAAGGHHLLMHGPPGGGKSMLARRLPGILPPLTATEAIEVALLWVAAGMPRTVNLTPPFRSPHHTASRAALIGGGTGMPHPGEASLAHNGVLFLDELAEYPRGHLDTLRQPIEEGVVSVARRDATVQFPARFQLVCATNPCPCGYYGDDRRPCDCRPSQRASYRSRLSGPLVDRFDMVVRIERVESHDYVGPPAEPSRDVRKRVVAARASQVERGALNRDLPIGAIEMTREAVGLVTSAMERGVLTARGADRVQRVARSIADLAGTDTVGEHHVGEALVLRGGWQDD